MNTPSKLQIGLTLLLVAVIGWIIYANKNKIPETVPINSPDVTTQKAQVEWPSTEVKKEGINESTKSYSINASYPLTKDERISTQLKEFVDEEIIQFKNDISWASEGNVAPAEEQNLSLDIDYRNEKGSKVDTYVFTVLTYTGGAHGLQVTHTFSYDINGKIIHVTDLLKNGEAGLKTLSTFVIKDLNSRSISDETWISEGASPKIENYQNFTVSDNGLTFIFDPYQVAPYSAGAQNVTIPLTNFKSIANPAIF